MYHFNNLNDYEFEELCKDILSRMLDVKFRSYARGRDGGIDLRSEKNDIAQVKHYAKSPYRKLLSSLKQELSKIKERKFKGYYICVSNDLSPDNEDEIFDLFSNFIPSREHIITGKVLSEFLEREENIDIVYKHNKLWLSSTRILDLLTGGAISVDSGNYTTDIRSKVNLFVETYAYKESLRILEKHKSLLIIGGPGVGKSITSKMLVAKYISEGYHLKYTTSMSDINEIKRNLSHDEEVKEIVVLDDCLGQAYFKLIENQGREIISLISKINRSKNKKIILNSRVTVFNEAKLCDHDLFNYFESDNCKIHIIDMNQISCKDKALIFYNHLYHFNIPSSYYCNLLSYNKSTYCNNYILIINHKNYNPRIIETVTKPIFYNRISPDLYFSQIIQYLDNPHKIWEIEYTRRIETHDRYLLKVLYSLGETNINYDYVKKCFNAMIYLKDVEDHNLWNFEHILERLVDSFVKIINIKGEKFLSMINPSVNDYLDNKFKASYVERESFLKHSCSPNQYLRLKEEKEFYESIKTLFETDTFDSLQFENEETRKFWIINGIVKFKITDIQYKDLVLDFLSNGCKAKISHPLLLEQHKLIESILIDPLYKFYEIGAYLHRRENIELIFKELTLRTSTGILALLYDALGEDEELEELLKELVKEQADKYFSLEYECDTDVSYDGCDIDYYGLPALIEETESRERDRALDCVSELLDNLPKALICEEEDYIECVDLYWVEDTITQYFDSNNEPYKPSENSEIGDWERIKLLFEKSTLKDF